MVDGHQCHAAGCEAVDCHPELPFCRRHYNMLPELYRKLLWAGRRKDKVCGACNPREAGEVPLRADERWYGLLNLSYAVLFLIENEGCKSEWIDKGGFCWRCGVFDADKTHEQALIVIERFSLRRICYG